MFQTSIDPSYIPGMVEFLNIFPSNGKPDTGDPNYMACKVAGFIEEKVQQKNCRTCGTLRDDYHYYKVTPAGQFFLALARQQHDNDT